MEQRVSLITLAVDDLPQAVAFYQNIGWQAAQTGPGVAAFNLHGTVFGLYPWISMAADMGLDPQLAMRPSMTLGYNVREKTEVAQILEPLFMTATEAGALVAPHRQLIYLGKRAQASEARYLFALDISDLPEDGLASQFSQQSYFAELREIGPMIDGRDGSVMAYARAMLYWHYRHIYCGRCGQKTIVQKLGHQRKCGSASCGEMHFPRTDPAVIMLGSHLHIQLSHPLNYLAF